MEKTQNNYLMPGRCGVGLDLVWPKVCAGPYRDRTWTIRGEKWMERKQLSDMM